MIRYIQRDTNHLAGHDTHHSRDPVVPLGVMPGWEGDSTTKEEGGGRTKVRAGLSFSYAVTLTHTVKVPHSTHLWHMNNMCTPRLLPCCSERQ